MAEPGAGELRPEQRLGAALRRAREEGGISLRALARRLYRAHSNLVEYERGHRLAPVDVVEAYEAHLDLTPGSLVALHERLQSELWGEDVRRVKHTSPRFPPQLALHQLPAEVANFTGRGTELHQLRAVIADRPLDRGSPVIISAIAGMGGVGKSALALHLAHELAPRFPDAQLFVDLHGYEPRQRLSPSQALDRFLRALGVADEELPVGVEEQAARYRALLAGKRALVVLDNASSAEQVRPLLPGSSSSLVLITSRSNLAGLVATEGARLLSLDVLPAEEALDLLQQVIGEERVRAEPKEAAEVVRLCGYLPLAIRIIAARLATRPTMSIAHLTDHLLHKQRLSELTAGDRCVRASFALSHESLEPDAARLFRLLGLVVGADFGAPATAALADISVEQSERLLETLVDSHLVEPATGPQRYRFHDLLRLYAHEQLEIEESQDSARRALERMLEWYLATADMAEDIWAPFRHRLRGPIDMREGVLAFANPAQALAWCEAEHAGLTEAVHLAFEYGLHAISWLLADALRSSLAVRRRWSDLQEIHEVALTAARETHDSKAEAWMLTNLALPYRRQGHFEKAFEILKMSLEISRDIDDSLCTGRTLRHLGHLHCRVGGLSQAIECFQHSLTICEQGGYRLGEALALGALGDTCRLRNDQDNAIIYYEASLLIAQGLGERRWEALMFLDLGMTHFDAERFNEAREHLRQAVKILQEIGDRWIEAVALKYLGSSLQRAGQTVDFRTSS